VLKVSCVVDSAADAGETRDVEDARIIHISDSEVSRIYI